MSATLPGMNPVMDWKTEIPLIVASDDLLNMWVRRAHEHAVPRVRATSSGIAVYDGFLVPNTAPDRWEQVYNVPVITSGPRDPIDLIGGQVRYRLGEGHAALLGGPFKIDSGGGNAGWVGVRCLRCKWEGRTRAWSQRRHMVTEVSRHRCDDLDSLRINPDGTISGILAPVDDGDKPVDGHAPREEVSPECGVETRHDPKTGRFTRGERE